MAILCINEGNTAFACPHALKKDGKPRVSLTTMKKLFHSALVFLAFPSCLAKTGGSVEEWWQSKTATGDWFGARTTLEDCGIDFSTRWSAVYAGVVAGGLQQRSSFVEQLRFELDLDFAKLTGWEALEGLSFTARVRWRDGSLINQFAGASNAFSPVSFRGGHGWRIMPFYPTYTTPELFGKKEFLTLSGGWQNPYELFAQQPGSKLFRNSVITSGKGISANDVTWSSSYAAWGGYLKVKPDDSYYAMAGLYMAIPNATDRDNHGLYFKGSPGNNGLFFVGETGVTPTLGPGKLPGKYAFGGYYWGLENTSFNGEIYQGRFGFYWQADQMLWREPSPATAEEKDAGVKSSKLPLAAKPKLSDQGLYWFSFFNFGPSYNSLRPFYFHTGLIYKGLIPNRDQDQLGVAFAFANYSHFNQLVQKANDDPVQTFEAVLDWEYRIQVNKWAIVQPFLEYVIRPDGAGLVNNVTVLGLYFHVDF